MKKLILVILICNFFTIVLAQDSMEKIMEKRAREMHRVIGLSDKEQWKKFITENYSKALIARPMKSKVETSDNDGVESTSASGSMTNLEEKTKMFQLLYNDFGNSKILSVKPEGQTLEMILENKSGLKGIFQLKFENKSPYLIDGIGIEAN